MPVDEKVYCEDCKFVNKVPANRADLWRCMATLRPGKADTQFVTRDSEVNPDNYSWGLLINVNGNCSKYKSAALYRTSANYEAGTFVTDE